MKNVFLCVLSVFLLRLAFPPWDLWAAAWIGLVPFLCVLEGKRPGAGFGYGYLLGIFFFGSTLWWFIHVTLPGMILLVAYLGLYFAVFGLCHRLFSHRPFLSQLFLLPSLWVALEYLRGGLFTGFGWVTLGQSQYKNLTMIQIADITGMYGVSFLVVVGNVLLKEWGRVLAEGNRKGGRGRGQSPGDCPLPLKASGVVLVLFSLCFIYGLVRLHEIKADSQASVTVIQANIPQEDKWQHTEWLRIMEKHRDLTRKAAQEKPDLIVWPETAFPGFLWESPQLFLDLKDEVRNLGIPLLLGAVTQKDEQYYNSAILIGPTGLPEQQHDKIHLVPFGEYVPLRGLFPFLSHLVPIGDFTPGKEYTLFSLRPKGKGGSPPRPAGGAESPFGVLICFEDTLSSISRRFTQEGAQFLVNITNDAWFLDTPAPFMHLQASVFRAVENRRSLIRSANTGVSSFVDPWGRIYQYVQDTDGKKTFVEGYAQAEVALSQEAAFYTKFGDVFAYLCFGGILWGIFKTGKHRFLPDECSKTPLSD